MATEAGWERFEATGWVRTQGLEPRRVHETDDKVHLAGGWTRFRADDSPIISNRVLYVLTRLEQGWGIQARFGVDSFVEGADRSAQEQHALAALALTMTTLEAGDVEAWLDCFHYPLTIVGAPGMASKRWPTPTRCAQHSASGPAQRCRFSTRRK